MTAQKKWQCCDTLPKLKNQDPIISADESDLFSILTGLAIQRGHRIHRLEGGYLISQWCMTRLCPDIPSLANALSRMGCDIPKNIASSATPERATGTFNHSKI